MRDKGVKMLEVSVYYPVGRMVVDEKGQQVKTLSDKVKVEFVLPRRPFLFWAEHHIAERFQFPRGYGAAYRDMLTDRVLMAPMPFNVMVGFAIWVYQWMRIGGAVWFDRHRTKGVS